MTSFKQRSITCLSLVDLIKFRRARHEKSWCVCVSVCLRYFGIRHEGLCVDRRLASIQWFATCESLASMKFYEAMLHDLMFKFIFMGASRNIVLTEILKNSLQLRKTPRPQILRDQWLCQAMATGIRMSMQNMWRKVSKKCTNLGLLTQTSIDSRIVNSRIHLLFCEELFFTSHYSSAVSIRS